MSRLPSLYISHGSPMTALHPGQVGVRLAELARDLPTPRAIVMASAHWLGRQPLVGAHPQPPTIHDFGGFPRALFELQYPAPGDPALAEEVAGRIAAAGLPVALDPQRGLDHGAWVPLRLLRPQADITARPCSITAGRRRSPNVRTRPTSTCCRCSSRWARPARAASVHAASTPVSMLASSPWICTASTGHEPGLTRGGPGRRGHGRMW